MSDGTPAIEDRLLETATWMRNGTEIRELLVEAATRLRAVEQERDKAVRLLMEIPNRIQDALYEEYCGPKLADIQDDIRALFAQLSKETPK